MTHLAVEHLFPAQSRMGEGPLWDAESGRLFWTDGMIRAVHAIIPGFNSCDTITLERAASSVVLGADGGLIAVFGSRIASVGANGEATKILARCEDAAAERFNDVVADPLGRLWAGSLDRDSPIWQQTSDPPLPDPRGRLYIVEADGAARSFPVGIELSNGIAIAPDGQRLYHIDSHRACIFEDRLELEAGTVSDRHVMFDFGHKGGHPDGMAVDTDGCLWVAEIGAGRIVRITPDGRRDLEVELPTSRPTSVAFGGGNLDTLFVTTMQLGLSQAELAAQPFAGDLFAIEGLGAQGVFLPRFGQPVPHPNVPSNAFGDPA